MADRGGRRHQEERGKNTKKTPSSQNYTQPFFPTAYLLHSASSPFRLHTPGPGPETNPKTILECRSPSSLFVFVRNYRAGGKKERGGLDDSSFLMRTVRKRKKRHGFIFIHLFKVFSFSLSLFLSLLSLSLLSLFLSLSPSPSLGVMKFFLSCSVFF